MIRVVFRGQGTVDDVSYTVHPDDEALFVQFAVRLLERLEAELNKDRPDVGHKGMSWPTDAQEIQQPEAKSFLGRWKHKRAQ